MKLALPGRFEKLVRKNVRQMFSVLDTYLAILIGLAGLGYRLLARDPDRAAFPMLAMLAALALSTYAQCLFSLDGVHPTDLAHGFIANEMIASVNRTFGASIPPVDLNAAATATASRLQPASGAKAMPWIRDAGRLCPIRQRGAPAPTP